MTATTATADPLRKPYSDPHDGDDGDDDDDIGPVKEGTSQDLLHAPNFGPTPTVRFPDGSGSTRVMWLVQRMRGIPPKSVGRTTSETSPLSEKSRVVRAFRCHWLHEQLETKKREREEREQKKKKKHRRAGELDR